MLIRDRRTARPGCRNVLKFSGRPDPDTRFRWGRGWRKTLRNHPSATGREVPWRCATTVSIRSTNRLPRPLGRVVRRLHPGRLPARRRPPPVGGRSGRAAGRRGRHRLDVPRVRRHRPGGRHRPAVPRRHEGVPRGRTARADAARRMGPPPRPAVRGGTPVGRARPHARRGVLCRPAEQLRRGGSARRAAGEVAERPRPRGRGRERPESGRQLAGAGRGGEGGRHARRQRLPTSCSGCHAAVSA